MNSKLGKSNINSLAKTVSVAALGFASVAGAATGEERGGSLRPAGTAPKVAEVERTVTLEPLVVTAATRTERLLDEVPVRTEVVLSEDIQLRAATDFSQAVELLNGVRIESNCQNCNTAEVQLLGLGGAYNQVLFDGTPLLSTLGGVYGIEQIPAAFVDRIEVVKGGGSSLYGAGAVGGVVNLVTLKPVRAGGFVRGVVELQEEVPMWSADGRADFAKPDGKVAVSVVAQGEQNDAIDFNSDGFSEITEKELRVGGFQVWVTPSERTRVSANYQYTWEDRRGGNELGLPPHLANIAEALETRYHRGGATWEQVVALDLDFRLAYAFAYVERESYYGGLGDPSEPGYDPAAAAATAFNQYGFTENPLHYLDAQVNYRVGDHAIAFGVQYKHESVRDRNRDALGVTLATTLDDSYHNTGVFLQDEWAVNERLDLVLGARLDDNSELDDLVFSPRVAVAYEAAPTLKLRAGVSTGFRAPEVFSEDLHVDTLGGAPVPVVNAAGLDKESAVTGMLGFDWRSDTVAPRWAWDGMFSVTDIDDTFILTRLPDGIGGEFEERSNASGSRITGLETNLTFQPTHHFRYSVGIAYYESRYEQAEDVFDDGLGTVITTRDYLKTPDWSGVAQAVWTPNDAWSTFAGVKYTGPMDVLNNNTATLSRTGDFWVFDLGVTRHFRLGRYRHLDVSVGVRNLFDERQKDLETGPSRDSDYVYGPRFARSFYVSVLYEF